MEKAQWTLTPKEEDAATTAEEREQEDVATIAEEREQEDEQEGAAITAKEKEQEDAATTAEEREQEDAAREQEDAATTAEEREQEDAATTAKEKEQEDAAREQEDAATIAEEREQEDEAATAAEPQAEEREPKPKSKPTKLSENNHSVLNAKLTKYSAQWREIGTHLGFYPYELNEIQARPPLYTTASKTLLSSLVPKPLPRFQCGLGTRLLLSAMLADWLQWAPGDQRGSTSYATLEGLSDALNEAGLSEAAQSITREILKPMT